MEAEGNNESNHVEAVEESGKPYDQPMPNRSSTIVIQTISIYIPSLTVNNYETKNSNLE